jgi:hypothetical protein
MKNFISIIILLSISQLAHSQDLPKDSLFFYNQLGEYKEWIKEAGFDKVIGYENIEISNDKVILRFSLKSDLDWFGLKKACNPKDPNSINELLFYRMTHLFELPMENAEIILTDHKKYYVNISYQNNRLLVIEPNPKGFVKNSLSIPVIKINSLQSATNQDVIESNEDKVKSLIINYLQNTYKNKTARFSKANLKIWQDENTIYVKISNITKEIIYDGLIGYWELIDIIIKVEQVNNHVRINYMLQGKYGAGIFVAPRQNDFVDMERDYKIYLDTYNDQLKSNIRNELLKKR